MLKDALTRVRERVDPIISGDDFPAAIRPTHLRNAVTDYPSRGGKRLRPALVLWSCGVFGGNLDSARRVAACVEIYHNWTLVHDDVIDDDSRRRGRPTCHVQLSDHARSEHSLDESSARIYGTNMAILAGDLQQAWATSTLLKSTEDGVADHVALALAKRLQELVGRQLISGEALDVDFSQRPIGKTAVKDVEEMLTMKTGALLRFCAESGAAIAFNSSDFNAKPIAALGDSAEAAGVAFQLKDDWLGVFGNEGILGKPVCSDVRERKPTTLMIAALEGSSPSAERELRGFLGKRSFTKGDVNRIRKLVMESGADRAVLARAETFANRARAGVSSLPDNEYRRLLEAWTDYLIERDV